MNKTLFIIISIIFLIWNFFGIAAFFSELFLPEIFTEQMTSEQATMYNQRPAWYLFFYGLATIAGFVAPILLLARSKKALLFALLSLIGIIVTTGYNFYSGAADMVSGSDQFLLLTVPILSVLLMVFARYAASKGMLR